MYPAEELNRIAMHKVALRHRIAVRRAQCIENFSQASRPLEWLDRMLAYWRKLSPFARFAAVPLGFLVKRKIFPRTKMIGSLFRWGPILLAALRHFRSAAKARSY